MASDGFTRCIEDVDKALTIATSRRALALQERGRAEDAVQAAERELLRAEQNRLLRERHVELCDKSITGLLDERLRSQATEGERVLSELTDAAK
jgi:hypothetical protein